MFETEVKSIRKMINGKERLEKQANKQFANNSKENI